MGGEAIDVVTMVEAEKLVWLNMGGLSGGLILIGEPDPDPTNSHHRKSTTLSPRPFNS